MRAAGMRPSGPFVEVADRVFQARYRQWDVGVGLVVGSTGALAVDTRGTWRQGSELVDDIAALGLGVPVTTVVTTHVHFDHTFGNGAFTRAEVVAHDRVRATFEADAVRLKALAAVDPQPSAEFGYSAQDIADLLDTQPRGPDRVLTESLTIDLGGRKVTLAYTGRGHTDGDIRIAADGVVFLGDLVEESAPPSLGGDSYPLEWPGTLDGHLAAIGAGDVVLPGHGRAMTRADVVRQREELAAIATVITERHAADVPLVDAQREPDSRLPYPLDRLDNAFARGYAALDLAQD